MMMGVDSLFYIIIIIIINGRFRCNSNHKKCYVWISWASRILKRICCSSLNDSRVQINWANHFLTTAPFYSLTDAFANCPSFSRCPKAPGSSSFITHPSLQMAAHIVRTVKADQQRNCRTCYKCRDAKSCCISLKAKGTWSLKVTIHTRFKAMAAILSDRIRMLRPIFFIPLIAISVDIRQETLDASNIHALNPFF